MEIWLGLAFATLVLSFWFLGSLLWAVTHFKLLKYSRKWSLKKYLYYSFWGWGVELMSGGSFDSLFSGLVTGTKVEVSDKPADIGAYHMLNMTAAPAFVQFFYTFASQVTVGTTEPDIAIPLPSSGGATLILSGSGWRTRGDAITIAATTTRDGATGASVEVVLWKAR